MFSARCCVDRHTRAAIGTLDVPGVAMVCICCLELFGAPSAWPRCRSFRPRPPGRSHGVHQGADAGCNEVDETDALVRTVERLPVLQRNVLQMWAVARLGDAAMLRAGGADLVVRSLDEVTIDALVGGRLCRRPT